MTFLKGVALRVFLLLILFYSCTSEVSIELVEEKKSPNFIPAKDEPKKFIGFGGRTETIAKNGNYIYLGKGKKGMVIYDLIDISNPKRVKQIEFEHEHNDYLIDENYLYVAAGDDGLAIYDVSNVENPKFISFVATADTCVEIKKQGNFIYSADTTGMSVIDISDIRNPEIKGRYLATSGIYTIATSNNYVFAIDGSNFVSIDISDSKNPVLVSAPLGLGLQGIKIQIFGNKVIVAFRTGEYSGIQSVNVSDPLTPLIESLDFRKYKPYPSSLLIAGNKAYITHESRTAGSGYENEINGVDVYDISDTTNISFSGHFYSVHGANDSLVIGDDLIVGSFYGGLDIYDVRISQGYPTFLDLLDTPVGGANGAIVADGNLLYIADNSYGLRIVDASDPTNLSYHATEDTPGYAVDIEKRGNYVFIADYDSGLQIMDVSTTTNPIIVGNYTSRIRNLRVNASGTRTYVANSTSGFYEILDTSDRTNPTFLKQVAPLYGGFFFDETYLYVGIEDGFEIFDVTTDENNPISVGSFTGLDGSVVDMKILGNSLYVATSETFYIFNVTDKSNSTLIGKFWRNGWSNKGFDTNGSIAMLGGWSSYIILDVSDPSNITMSFLDHIPHAWVYDVAIAGNIGYLANSLNGTLAFDIADMPLKPKLSTSSVGSFSSVFPDGDKVYCSDSMEGGGVGFVEYRPGKEPKLNRILNEQFAVLEIFKESDRLYSIDETSIFKVHDISDPNNIITSENTGRGSKGIYVEENIVYSLSSTGRLYIYDTTDMSNFISFLPFGRSYSGESLFYDNKTLYIAAGSDGGKIVDVSDVTNPLLLSTFDTAGSAEDFVMQGNIGHIADDSNGVVTIDITDKTNPTLISTISSSGNVLLVRRKGDYLYFADTSDGLQIYDVSDPSNPELVANTGVGVSDLKFQGDIAYLACGVNGLKLMNIKDPRNPIITK